MKVIVSTKETQGERAGDFCHLPEGALVGFTDTHRGERVDAPCGCQRALGGLRIDRSSTTFKVVEREMSRDEYVREVVRANAEFVGGPVTVEHFEAEADELLRVAAHFPAGGVIEKRKNVFRMRGPAGLRRAADLRLRRPAAARKEAA